MAILQNHHMTYEPDVTVELKMSEHRVISRIQNTKATMDEYIGLTNLLHAVTHEWNRMRMELHTGLDLRVKKPKAQKKKAKKKKRKLKRR